MSDRTQKLTPEAAWDRLDPFLAPLGPRPVDRAEALGAVLSESLQATVDVPGTDVSAMDGYALSSIAADDEHWPVASVIAAGDSPGFQLPAGRAAKIMTGAPVPAGADRVIPVEKTDGGSDRMYIETPVDIGANIRRKAEILRVGDEILSPGSRITPGALALIATHGYSSITVYRRPTVTVLTTGDEVIPPEREPRPGQLRDSHTDFLLSAGRTIGLDFDSLGIAPDEPRRLTELIRRGLESDVLLLGGGVSMGEFDLVEDVLADLECEILFDRVSIQPGKPLVVARHDSGLVFGLPGNPASVMACFWLFVRPALRRLQGIPDRFWSGSLAAELSGPLPAAPRRDRFLPAEIRLTNGKLYAEPTATKGSHDLSAFSHGSALVRITQGSGPAEIGDPCEILPLADWVADS